MPTGSVARLLPSDSKPDAMPASMFPTGWANCIWSPPVLAMLDNERSASPGAANGLAGRTLPTRGCAPCASNSTGAAVIPQNPAGAS